MDSVLEAFKHNPTDGSVSRAAAAGQAAGPLGEASRQPGSRRRRSGSQEMAIFHGMVDSLYNLEDRNILMLKSV